MKIIKNFLRLLLPPILNIFYLYKKLPIINFEKALEFIDN
jgi:hypothetical protein